MHDFPVIPNFKKRQVISEQNLRVVEGYDCACGRPPYVEALNTADTLGFVRGRSMEPLCKLLACPLFQLAILHKFNLGIGGECPPDVIPVPQSMRLEIQLDSVPWAVLRYCHGREDDSDDQH